MTVKLRFYSADSMWTRLISFMGDMRFYHVDLVVSDSRFPHSQVCFDSTPHTGVRRWREDISTTYRNTTVVELKGIDDAALVRWLDQQVGEPYGYVDCLKIVLLRRLGLHKLWKRLGGDPGGMECAELQYKALFAVARDHLSRTLEELSIVPDELFWLLIPDPANKTTAKLSVPT